LSRGRYFSTSEEDGAGKVAMVGAKIAKQLFDTDNPVGHQIRISSTNHVIESKERDKQKDISASSVPFEVIGVLAEKGSSGAGQNQDDVVFVPLSTAKVRLMGSGSQVNREALAYILVKVVSDEATSAATEAIEMLLRQRHRLGADRENDFEVINPAAIMAAQRASTTTIAWLLAAVASISLVVGGISIMNIMLVSVTERTREIGLRLAVGARRKDIQNQFLTEAVGLCLLGGVIGVGCGAVAAWAIAIMAGWPIYLGPEAALFAAGSSALVGIFFGYYPARKASALEPVVALRAE
jgi:putative ABC transport system permease protein